MVEVDPQDITPQTTEGIDVSDDETASITQTLAHRRHHSWHHLMQLTIEPSQQFPTRAFLGKKYRKTELQIRCRELGLTNVWTSKSQLIDMILQHTRSLYNDTPVAVMHSPTTSRENTQTDRTQGRTDMLDIAKKKLKVLYLNWKIRI